MRMLALAAIVALSPCVAFAEEKPKGVPEYVTFDGKGFAWQDNWRDKDVKKRGPVVVYDIVSAWKGHVTVADCSTFQTKLKGVTWCFASEDNLKAFNAKTDDGENEYLPFAGGRCTLGVSWGLLGARGHPESARVITDPFGDAILVMHSNIKWWWQFKDEDLKRAMLAYNIASGPRIVPNEEFEKDTKKTN